jgi:hypothetical protein
MRNLNDRHREGAAELKMQAGEFADILDAAKDKIRSRMSRSKNPLFRLMASADDETFDAFMQEVLNGHV